MLKTRHASVGFTLLELVAVLAVMSLLSLGVLSGLASYLEFSQRQSTRLRIAQLRDSLERCFATRPHEVFSGPANTLTIAGTALPDMASMNAAQAGALISVSANLWSSLRTCSSPSLETLTSDGFNQPWLLQVSSDLLLDLPTVSIPYRVAVIISTGANTRLESAFDPRTGIVSVGGDDVAEVVDGIGIMQDLHAEALRKSRVLASAYREYFTTRYLASTSRAYEIDYFAGTDSSGNPLTPLWDGPTPEGNGGGIVGNTRGQEIPATAPELRLLDALGLAMSDVTLRAGFPLRVDNSSPAVNSPDNPDPARSLPPFSARVIAPLPGARELITTVSGVVD